MVAVALVLVVILGTSQVFKMSADTVSAGQRLSENNRDIRAAQATMNADFQAAMVDGSPWMMISCAQTFAWQNLADFTADTDANPQTVEDTGITVPTAAITDRSHRIDRIGFFGLGQFRRQTGNDNVLVANMTSAEAYIWYGHCKLRGTGSSSYFGPGEPTVTQLQANPAGFKGAFASDWVVGRVAILLRAPDAGAINDNAGQSQSYLVRTGTIGSPLTYGTQANDTARSQIQTSRFDLAGTSISDLLATIAGVAANSNWWQGLVNGASGRFQYECNPYVGRPIVSTNLAKATPYFMGHVSQFIVEYAGDWLTQAEDGSLNGIVPDGKLDFVATGSGPSSSKAVRWYGRPRDTSGDGVITGAGGASAGAGAMSYARNIVDVVPLRDFFYLNWMANQTGNPQPPQSAEFEKNGPAVAANYMASMAAEADYTCIWRVGGLPGPSMVRILMKIDDPTGRLKDGQWCEFTYKLK